jgi:hypothetical protein
MNSAASWRSGVAGHLAARETFTPLGEARPCANADSDATRAMISKAVRIAIDFSGWKQ